MKTVAEWAEYWATGKAMEMDQWVRAIQRDALEAAAKVCDSDAAVWKPESTTGMALRRVAARISASIPKETKRHAR